MAEVGLNEATSVPSKDARVAAYKKLLQSYIDRRPSGMRLKIAKAIGKHKSFVSQITNPAYPVPVPERHLETIFKICHFSPEERKSFLSAYREAHPEQPKKSGASGRRATASRKIEIDVPRLGDPDLEREIEDLIREFAARVTELVRKS